MIFLAALFAAQATPAETTPTIRRSQHPVARLEIPDEIALAIVPYLRCRLDSIGQPTYSGVGGPRIAPSAPVGANCSSARSEAARRAEQMLAEQGRRNGDERRAFVERTLAAVDAFAASAVPPTPTAQEKPDAED